MGSGLTFYIKVQNVRLAPMLNKKVTDLFLRE